jgi:hypothetical protein
MDGRRPGAQSCRSHAVASAYTAPASSSSAASKVRWEVVGRAGPKALSRGRYDANRRFLSAPSLWAFCTGATQRTGGQGGGEERERDPVSNQSPHCPRHYTNTPTHHSYFSKHTRRLHSKPRTWTMDTCCQPSPPPPTHTQRKANTPPPPPPPPRHQCQTPVYHHHHPTPLNTHLSPSPPYTTIHHSPRHTPTKQCRTTPNNAEQPAHPPPTTHHPPAAPA